MTLLEQWPLLVSRARAAQVLGVAPQAIDWLVETGRLPEVRVTPDTEPAYRPEDLFNLVDQLATESRGGRSQRGE